MTITHKGGSCTRAHLLWMLSWRGSPGEPKCLLWGRPGSNPASAMLHWAGPPACYTPGCMSSFVRMWGTTMWTPPFCTSSYTFLCWSFLSHILSFCLSVCWCCSFVLFSCCLNPQASLGNIWACPSGSWFLGLDSQVRNPVMLPWTWLNGPSGLADLWLLLPMFDLSKQTAVM